MASLDILAGITGKTLRKPIDPEAEEHGSERRGVGAHRMVRYVIRLSA